MIADQTRWNKTDQGVTTTLTISCTSEGQIHLETPSDQGAFSEDYSAAQEASQALMPLFERGLQEAGNLS